MAAQLCIKCNLKLFGDMSPSNQLYPPPFAPVVGPRVEKEFGSAPMSRESTTSRLLLKYGRTWSRADIESLGDRWCISGKVSYYYLQGVRQSRAEFSEDPPSRIEATLESNVHYLTAVISLKIANRRMCVQELSRTMQTV
jgi:hypothetical protein